MGYTDRRIIRPFTYFRHAEAKINFPSSALDLADGIAALKRAVSIRVQWLDRIYNFSKLLPKVHGHLFDYLHDLGVIRPLLWTKLRTIRNKIEHQDRKPPSQGQCQELLDVVWYLLRSTDAIAREFCTSLYIYPAHCELADPSEYLSLQTADYKSWKPLMTGCVHEKAISIIERPRWLKLGLLEINKINAAELVPKMLKCRSRRGRTTGKFLYFTAELNSSTPVGLYLLRRYFNRL